MGKVLPGRVAKLGVSYTFMLGKEVCKYQFAWGSYSHNPHHSEGHL